MEFIINDRRYTLTREEVELAFRDVRPDTSRGGLKHFVEINGRGYPVKQALRIALRGAEDDFTSHRARDIFKRLGFTLFER